MASVGRGGKFLDFCKNLPARKCARQCAVWSHRSPVVRDRFIEVCCVFSARKCAHPVFTCYWPTFFDVCLELLLSNLRLGCSAVLRKLNFKLCTKMDDEENYCFYFINEHE
ncbi:Death domain-containing protein [Trichinella pseudospiralis]